MKKYIIILISICCTIQLWAQQNYIEGKVFTINEEGKKESLVGANVYWALTTKGTTTDNEGYFVIKRIPMYNQLVFSYIGFKNDTILISEKENQLEIILFVNNNLQEVVIKEKRQSSFVSRLETIQTQILSGESLKKAACCNLSESFETDNSVDVEHIDAVSGAKRISMLGLSGLYTQINTENMQSIRGLAVPFGMEYIPGSWIESIQISKGTSSVLNGFESITGQINVEYKKPADSEKLYLNLFGNHFGAAEANLIASTKVSERLSTMLLGHFGYFNEKNDFNSDGFLDMPMKTQYNFVNRWQYINPNKLQSIFTLKYVKEDRLSGQKQYYENSENNPFYGIEISQNRWEAALKGGYFLNHWEETSIGIFHQFSLHDLKSNFGLKNYDANQLSYNGRIQLSSILGNEKHKYSTGISFYADYFDQSYLQLKWKTDEFITGAFFEYVFQIPDKISVVTGIRGDVHSEHGFFATPRLHLKWNMDENHVLRASSGLGYRSAHVYAENIHLLASAKNLSVANDLEQEQAWNSGIAFTKYAKLFDRNLTMTLDAYRTEFLHQVVIDANTEPDYISVYNLSGKSYSNSLQLEVQYELLKGLDLIAAAKWNDVKITENELLKEKAMVNRYKAMLNLSYKTLDEHWQFDYTMQFNGKSRLYAHINEIKEYSPRYQLVNAQITYLMKNLEIYTGGENLGNFVQKNPIFEAENPFGSKFDATRVWGPISGRKFYLGLRYFIH